jgi:hypothetical protein
MPPRYTIRQVVGTYRRKAFGTLNPDGTPRRPAYPPDAIVAFYGTLELAEEQPTRGHFESERLLRVLLEGPDGRGRRFARRVPFLVSQGDLVPAKGGGLDVEGWDILQEGDTTIADRVARFRSRKRNAPANAPANGAANGDVTADVTEDPRAGDDARDATRPQRRGDGYEEEGTTPLPPTSGGRRANGTNPRALSAEVTRRANTAEAERRARRKARHVAYLDGRITEAQRLEMDERDAPLSEIPTKRGAAYQGVTP